MSAGILSDIPLPEVLLYLGWKGGEPDPNLRKTLSHCVKTIQTLARPQVLWRRFAVSGTHVDGTTLTLEGQDIGRHLEHCHEAILMAATLGPQVERHLMRTQVLDMAEALILDSVASAAIENVCNNLEATLRTAIEGEGLFLTDRFSPGYGDFPIQQQRLFCDVLDTQRRIGLTVSGSGLLLPRKSVTAVLGISPVRPQRRSSGCANCSQFYTCQIRQNGRFCQSQSQM